MGILLCRLATRIIYRVVLAVALIAIIILTIIVVIAYVRGYIIPPIYGSAYRVMLSGCTLDFRVGMRPAGFEPATRGLEGLHPNQSRPRPHS